MREFIFGDCALDRWPVGDERNESEPWRSFVAARDALAGGDAVSAEATWRAIAAMPDIESRHVLQAWHFLRSIGAVPPVDMANHVLGAVAEVAVPDGHDLLAAYEDGSVRYLNVSGAASIIDDRIESVAGPAAAWLAVAQSIADVIGQWEGPLPPLPDGYSRLTMLTPSGPHFGQGPDAALRSDPMAGAFFEAATQTLVAVVALAH